MTIRYLSSAEKNQLLLLSRFFHKRNGLLQHKARCKSENPVVISTYQSLFPLSCSAMFWLHTPQKWSNNSNSSEIICQKVHYAVNFRLTKNVTTGPTQSSFSTCSAVIWDLLTLGMSELSVNGLQFRKSCTEFLALENIDPRSTQVNFNILHSGNLRFVDLKDCL